MEVVRILFSATTIVVLIVVVAALWVWGIWMKRMFHRRVGNRFPVGTFGIIPGAEPLTLTAPGAAMGVVWNFTMSTFFTWRRGVAG